MRCIEALCRGVDTSPPTGAGLLVCGVRGVHGEGGGIGVLGGCGVLAPRGVPLTSGTPPGRREEKMERHVHQADGMDKGFKYVEWRLKDRWRRMEEKERTGWKIEIKYISKELKKQSECKRRNEYHFILGSSILVQPISGYATIVFEAHECVLLLTA